MVFNDHWRLKDKHAFLSPSKSHWLRYSPEKLEERWFNSLAAEKGTALHAFAAQAIELGRRLPKNRDSVNMFVNDALGYSMYPERTLYYSDNCFGTSDAISFNKNLLRVHDLKTGITPASMEQLMVYAALFCLEYGKDPSKIDILLRIYQQGEREEYEPERGEVDEIMRKIIESDAIIEKLKNGTADI